MEYKYRKLEPGVTHAAFDRVEKLCDRIGWAGLFLWIVVGFTLKPSIEQPWLLVPLIVLAGLSAGCIACANSGVPGSSIADDRETKAGYTTVWYKAGGADLNLVVDLVDARTGIVLRESGQPQLTKEEYRSLLEAIRDEPNRVKERRR